MFSIQALMTRFIAVVTEQPSPDRGSIIVEYAFLFTAVVLVAMVAASAMGSSVVDLWTSNTERFATAVQPALEL